MTHHQGMGSNGMAGYRHIYLYYVKPGHEKHIGLRTYLIDQKANVPLSDVGLRKIVDDVEAGRLEGDFVGASMDILPWRHKAYLVFVLKEEAEELSDVTFHYNSETGPNHSFGPRLRFEFGSDVTGVYCINERINKDKKPLTASDKEPFHVNFQFVSRDKKSVVTHSETSTNTGP